MATRPCPLHPAGLAWAALALGLLALGSPAGAAGATPAPPRGPAPAQGGPLAAPSLGAAPMKEAGPDPWSGALDWARPEAVGLPREAMWALVRAAEASRSDALVVIKGEQVLVDRHFGAGRRALPLMSVTKGISSLAIGFLMAEGKLRSLDAPLSTWFPAWGQGPHAKITLRHVLTHTTGLEHPRLATQLNQAEDRLGHVLALPVAHPPGSHFAYSNEAFQLLAGVVQVASGEALDAYLKRRLFDPLGLKGWIWHRDAKGTPECYGGLAMPATELAKLGVVLAHEGRWKGHPLVPAAWMRQATLPQSPERPEMGLAWFLHHPWGRVRQVPARLALLEAAGCPGAAELKALNASEVPLGQYGRAVRERLGQEGAERFWAFAMAHGGLPTKVESGPVGFAAHDGWLGQYLAFDPRSRLVVVRMTRFREEGDRRPGDAWPDFYEGLKALRRSLPR